MSTVTETNSQRIEELGRIILAYSEITEKLQVSHEQLRATVTKLQAELGEKNKQLERRNRLAALGEMAAGMAHEIRNPLGGIQLYAGLLTRDLVDRPESAEVVRKISIGVRRMEAIVSQVLQFSREIRPVLVEMDLVDVVRNAIDLAGVEAEFVAPESLLVHADPNLISQCVMNLVRNAREAAGENGEVLVTTAKPPFDEAQGRQVADGKFTIVVEDSGPGISADVMEKIFNPFFTTKDTGTGLGLAIVHRIVEAHDGVIGASNRTDGGARFEIRI